MKRILNPKCEDHINQTLPRDDPTRKPLTKREILYNIIIHLFENARWLASLLFLQDKIILILLCLVAMEFCKILNEVGEHHCLNPFLSYSFRGVWFTNFIINC